MVRKMVSRKDGKRQEKRKKLLYNIIAVESTRKMIQFDYI